MLRFLCINLLALLLCSCMQTQSIVDDNVWRTEMRERIRIYDERQARWVNNFEQLPGTAVKSLIQAWGDPEKFENKEYHWVRRYKYEGGGYSVPDGYTTQTIYRNSFPIATIETPKERYIDPYTDEGISCKILVIADENGTITHASFADSTINPGSSCARNFPFPEE